MIAFATINRAAIAALPGLARIVPGGKIVAREYVALNPTRADRRPGSFKVNLRSGKWCDFANGDKGGDPVSLVAYVEGVSQPEAARRLARMLGLDTRRAGVIDDLDDNRFAPLTESELAAVPAFDDAAKDESECVMPVPANAPALPDAHPKLGKPSAQTELPPHALLLELKPNVCK